MEIAYKDQNTPVVFEKVEIRNERQKVEISAVKKDAESGKLLAGAEFALYEEENLLSTAITGEDGKAVLGKEYGQRSSRI